jgi:hypothetical protein
MKTKNKILIFVFIIIGLLNVGDKKTLASNFEFTSKNSFINITEESYNRVNEFLDGRFYSKNLNNKFFDVYGLYFALSKSGSISVFSFCDDDVTGCNENLIKYQTYKKCTKYSGEECYIILIKNKLILNKKIIKINKENKKNIKQYFKISGKQNTSYEIRAFSYKDSGSDDWE